MFAFRSHACFTSCAAAPRAFAIAHRSRVGWAKFYLGFWEFGKFFYPSGRRPSGALRAPSGGTHWLPLLERADHCTSGKAVSTSEDTNSLAYERNAWIGRDRCATQFGCQGVWGAEPPSRRRPR